MNPYNTDSICQQHLFRCQLPFMVTRYSVGWHDSCQSDQRQRESGGTFGLKPWGDFFENQASKIGDRARGAAWGAGCPPRPSRVAGHYRALFFAGRFFGLAWQLLWNCEGSCHASPKKRYAKNQSALMPRHACWVLEQPAPHAAPLALSPIFDA